MDSTGPPPPSFPLPQGKFVCSCKSASQTKNKIWLICSCNSQEIYKTRALISVVASRVSKQVRWVGGGCSKYLCSSKSAVTSVGGICSHFGLGGGQSHLGGRGFPSSFTLFQICRTAVASGMGGAGSFSVSTTITTAAP